MPRLIDADEFEKRIKPYDTEDGMDKALYNFAHYHLVTTPSIEPVRMKGRWVRISNEPFADIFECSNCGQEPPIYDYEWCLSNYCPNCGFDMREGEEE